MIKTVLITIYNQGIFVYEILYRNLLVNTVKMNRFSIGEVTIFSTVFLLVTHKTQNSYF